MNKKYIINEIRKTIKQLLTDPKETDTIKALEKQIDSLRDCKYSKTGKPVKGCSPCGNWIECGNSDVVADRVKSGVCAKCNNFETENV